MTFINAQKVERYFRLLILTNHQLSEKHSYRSFSHRNELIFLLIIKQKGILCNNYFLTSDFPENVKFFCNIFSKKIFNIVYLLFIIYNDIIRLQLQLFLSSFLKKCIEKRLSSGSHFLYAPLSFILLIFPFH